MGTAKEDPDEAYEVLDEAMELFDDSEPVGRFMTLLFKSVVDFMVGDIESSLRRREETMRMSIQLDMPELVAWMHWNLALSYYATSDYHETARRFHESFDNMAAENYQEGVASNSVGAGLCEIAAGRMERGSKLFGAADAALDRIGTVIWPEAAFHIEAAKDKIKSEAGEAFFQEHYSSGRQLSFTETIQLTSEAFDELTAL